MPKGKTFTGSAKGSSMVDVAEVFKAYNKVGLLQWFNWAVTECSINIKHCSLCVKWCINDDGRYVLESAPVTAESAGVNFGVEQWLKCIVAGV